MQDFTARVESETEYPARPAADSRGYNRFFSKPVHAAPVPPRDRRARSAGALGANLRVSRDRGAPRKRRPPEVLLPVDVPLPFGQTAYGARAQLYHRRRDDPLPSDAGFQRSSADGMGRFRSARRKRGDGERRAPGEMDLRQHRRHEAAAALARLRDAGTSGCSCACSSAASSTRRPAR